MSEHETIHRAIAAALAEAAKHELQAREARRLAGQLLIRARTEARTDEPWLPPNMDQRSAKMPIELAAGGRVR